MLQGLSAALSGLFASSKRASVAASNIANAQTVGRADDSVNGQDPYTPLEVEQTTGAGGEVQTNLRARDPAFVKAYQPNSSFANADGLVGAPNVRLEEEIVSLKQAEIAYKANLKTIETISELQDELLDSIDKEA